MARVKEGPPEDGDAESAKGAAPPQQQQQQQRAQRPGAPAGGAPPSSSPEQRRQAKDIAARVYATGRPALGAVQMWGWKDLNHGTTALLARVPSSARPASSCHF